MIKECGFLEQLVISFIMLPNILGRALCLGVIFGLLKIYGAIVLIIVFVSEIIISCLESLICKTKITSRIFLGILTSFTSPCLIVIEQSKHFLVNGITGTVLYIMATWIVYFNASAIRQLLPNSNFTLECHGDFNNITANSIIRCPEVNSTDESDCYPGIFSASNSTNSNSQKSRLYVLVVMLNCVFLISQFPITIAMFLAEKLNAWVKLSENSCSDEFAFRVGV